MQALFNYSGGTTSEDAIPTYDRSAWHVADALGKFRQTGYTVGHNQATSTQDVNFTAPYRPFKKWLASLVRAQGSKADGGASNNARSFVQALLGRTLLPICYGGTFVAHRSRIQAVPSSLWRFLARSLERVRLSTSRPYPPSQNTM